MVAFPFCKINLGLQILSKRPDGYHSISTCFYPVQWTDILEIVPSKEMSFVQTGLLIPGIAEDNLCLRAYQKLKDDFDLSPVKIHLHKVIPMGAGLGGGSSDAAFTLKLLNSIFDLKISQEGLMTYAATMGSDCAFFIQNLPMLGSGRGEVLTSIPVDLKGYHIFIVNPGIHVSTRDAYAGIVPQEKGLELSEQLGLPIQTWKDAVGNDFEDSIFTRFPEIKQLKDTMYSKGALYASMSGSGSSVFGIFEKQIDWQPEVSFSNWSGTL